MSNKDIPRDFEKDRLLAAARLSRILARHGIIALPDQLIATITDDWKGVSTYSHIIHEDVKYLSSSTVRQSGWF